MSDHGDTDSEEFGPVCLLVPRNAPSCKKNMNSSAFKTLAKAQFGDKSLLGLFAPQKALQSSCVHIISRLQSYAAAQSP